MNDRQTVETLIRALPIDFSAGSDILDDQGEVLIDVSDELVVRLRLQPQKGQIGAAAYLIEMPDGADVETLTLLLQANDVLFNEYGLTLALDPDAGSILALGRVAYEGLAPDAFAAWFGTFAEHAILARRAVLAGMLEREEDEDTASAAQAEPWIRA